MKAFVTQLDLVDLEDGHAFDGESNLPRQAELESLQQFSPWANSMVAAMNFSASDLNKSFIKSTSTSHAGETYNFDVVRREELDDIMQCVSSDRQSEDFARTMRDTLEAVCAMTPAR